MLEALRKHCREYSVMPISEGDEPRRTVNESRVDLKAIIVHVDEMDSVTTADVFFNELWSLIAEEVVVIAETAGTFGVDQAAEFADVVLDTRDDAVEIEQIIVANT